MSQAGLEKARVIVGIDFTASNEWQVIFNATRFSPTTGLTVTFNRLWRTA